MNVPLLVSLQQHLYAVGQGTGLRAQLMRGGVGSIALKFIHTMLMFLVTVALARALGPEGYGAYAFVYALIAVLAMPATMGLPQLMVRETAKAKSRTDWGLMRGLWRWSSLATLGFSLTVAVAILIVLAFLDGGDSDTRAYTLLAGLVLVPLIALGQIRDGALQGLGRVLLGQLAENVVRPSLIILFILTAVSIAGITLSATSAMALHATAAGIAFLVGATLLKMYRPAGIRARPVPRYEPRAWLNAIVPLALISGMGLINQYTDILMLGLFESDAQIGVYRVATQGAMLVAFGLKSMNLVLQPLFARLYIQDERARLQSLATQSARAILAMAVPVVLLYLFFGGELLIAVFGTEYGAGYAALVILSVGQLINAAAGSVGGLLVMTGNERDTLRGLAIAAVANLLLNFLLIPMFGMAGAASATACSLLFRNVLLWHRVRKRLGVNSSVIKFSIRRLPS